MGRRTLWTFGLLGALYGAVLFLVLQYSLGLMLASTGLLDLVPQVSWWVKAIGLVLFLPVSVLLSLQLTKSLGIHEM